jgi:phosphoribosylformylglycinamidine synthase I
LKDEDAMTASNSMKAGVIVFPGSNCDRDLAVAFERAGADVTMVWHKDTHLPEGLDIVGVPGGFSFGDYLRCGAIAANSPITRSLIRHAERGGYVLGICNGFQVLTETGLLPGALMRNSGLKFICRDVELKVATTNSAFTAGYKKGQRITVPIAHHDGNYQLTGDKLKEMQDEDRIAFTYTANPNGSVADIAGVLSTNRRVLGMMPHPERAVDPAHGGTDGVALFRSLMGALVSA